MMAFMGQQSPRGSSAKRSSGCGLSGSIGHGKSRESRQELGRAAALPTSLSGLMGQARSKSAADQTGPDAVAAVGCRHRTRRTGEPSTGGRPAGLDAARIGHSDRECKTGDTESTFLRAIASKAQRNKRHRFVALYRHVNEELLTDCWSALNKRAASGVDRVTPRSYGRQLAENIRGLVGRLRAGL